MDSVPPAIIAEAFPVMMVCAPRIMALRLEAQTLFTVVHTVDVDRPAPIAHCLAGFCPRLPQADELMIDWNGSREVPRDGSLCRDDIAEENLLHVLGID